MYYKSRIGRMGMMVAGLLVCAGLALGAGVTIYVDAANTEGPWDGSAANPWQTIGDGVDHLAVVNDDVQGGHTVLVAAGTYNESVGLPVGVSGVDGNRNILLADGTVIINNAYPFVPNGDWLVIDGFTLREFALGAVQTWSGFSDSIIRNCRMERFTNVTDLRQGGIGLYNAGDNLVVSNCVFIGLGHAITVTRGSPKIEFVNCTIVDGVYAFWGHASHSGAPEINVSNSIVHGAGIAVFHTSRGTGSFIVRESLVYGMPVVIDDLGNKYYTEEEINALDGSGRLDFEDVVVAPPGFSDLHNDWNVNQFYANSPALKENSGFAVDMGAYLDPPTVAVSSNTYYVNATGGLDSRSPAEAQNESTPWLTISKAASHAVAGDTVIVKAGIYEESVMITNSGSGSLNITFRAGDGVVVNGGAHGFRLDRAGAVVLDGFAVTGATTAGIYLNQSPGNTIINGSCFGNADGIRMSKSPGCLIDRMNIYANTGSGINTYNNRPSGGLLTRSRIQGNGEHGVSLNVWNRFWRIQNCNVSDNASHGIRLNVGSGHRAANIENCTIVGNSGDGVQSANNSSPRVWNSIIADNDRGVWESAAESAAILSHNCFYGNGVNFYHKGDTVLETESEINAIAGCSDNIVADPLFADAVFRLSLESPCIDAGTPTTDLETDFFGNPRLTGAAVNIGLHERPPPLPTVIFVR